MKDPEMQSKLRRDLITTNVGEELLVYDPVSHRAHSLSPTAAALFRALQAGEGLPSQQDEESTSDILESFAASGLTEPTRTQERTTRRESLKLLGRVALVPLITSIALPVPAHAASNTVTEAQCNAGNGCGMMCAKPSPVSPVSPDRRCQSLNGVVCGCVDVNAAAPFTPICACDQQLG